MHAQHASAKALGFIHVKNDRNSPRGIFRGRTDYGPFSSIISLARNALHARLLFLPRLGLEIPSKFPAALSGMIPFTELGPNLFTAPGFLLRHRPQPMDQQGGEPFVKTIREGNSNLNWIPPSRGLRHSRSRRSPRMHRRSAVRHPTRAPANRPRRIPRGVFHSKTPDRVPRVQ